jgi:hypothetical protein
MSLDTAKMSAQALEYYFTLGNYYSTQSVLAQGDKTLQGLAKYATILVEYGFGTKYGDRLALACDTLQSKVVHRAEAAGTRKLSGKTYLTTSRKARKDRLVAVNTLAAAIPELLEGGQVTAAQLVETKLEQMSRLESDEQLPAQLQLLHDVLVHPDVAGAVADRNGPAIATRVKNARTAMIDALRERAGQTPVSAAVYEREVVEGVIVSLARSANAAARLAASDLGQPAIALAFKLTHLERKRAGADASAPETPEAPEAPELPEAPEAPGDEPSKPGDGEPITL